MNKKPLRPTAAPKPFPQQKTAPEADTLPPHSTEDEQAALGCVLLASESFQDSSEARRLLDQLKSPMFYDLRHRQIFRAMTELAAAGHATDSLLVSKWLEEHAEPKDKTLRAYLAECIAAVPSVFNFPSYLANLTDKARRRNLILLSARAAELAKDTTLDPAVIRAEFAEQLEAVSAAGVAEQALQIVTHKALLDYVPPSNLRLVGDHHINRGSLFVIGGPPGCGKSRLTTTLGVAGARGKGTWMGYQIHTQFRTLILQAENGLYRLKTEWANVPASAEEFMCVSAPPPGGLAFHNANFRAAVKAKIRDWQPGIIIIDPWNSVVGEEGQADYKTAMDYLLTTVPQGDNGPAIGIVAHMRKPKSEGMQTGRGMLNELSGSLYIGSRARSAFFLLPGSDDVQDDTVVFVCRKNNDGAFGADTAWTRQNGEFAPVEDFDWQEFWTPSKGGPREVTSELMATILDNGKRWLSLNQLAKELMASGFGKSASYQAHKRFAAELKHKDGLLTWKGFTAT